MKKWIIVEAGMVVAIILLSWLIKAQITPVAQAEERQEDNFEILVQTESGLIPYSQVEIVKIEIEEPSYLFSYQQDIQNRIRELEPELANTLILLANCESTLNPLAVGDNGHSHGLYQIYLRWHPDVTLEQAQDIDFATNWTANKIRQGQGHLWTCWNKI